MCLWVGGKLVCQEPQLEPRIRPWIISIWSKLTLHCRGWCCAPPKDLQDKGGIRGGGGCLRGGWENSITINVGRIEGYKGESKAMTLFLGHGAATRWLTEFSSITTTHHPPPTALPAVWDLGIGIGQNWPGEVLWGRWGSGDTIPPFWWWPDGKHRPGHYFHSTPTVQTSPCAFRLLLPSPVPFRKSKMAALARPLSSRISCGRVCGV